MFDFSKPDALAAVKHHPAIEQITDMICERTQNLDRGFFQLVVAFFLAKMASTMRATIVRRGGSEIPVNLFAQGFATSGYGKGYSMDIMQDELIKGFRDRFMEDTFHVCAEESLWRHANRISASTGQDEQYEKNSLEAELKARGAYVFSAATATPASIHQIREKLLLAGCGAFTLQVDEIGSNLLSATDTLTLMMILFDQGKADANVTKNTGENTRMEQIDGKTPTNMLLFGTPSKVFDNGPVEKSMLEFYETGQGRRNFYAWGERVKTTGKLTAKEIYERSLRSTSSAVGTTWATRFTQLADPAKMGWRVDVPDDVGITLMAYKLHCEELAAAMPETDTIRRPEMEHRYAKAQKLAGAFAFVDESSEMTMDHILQAIKMAEESGQAFERILAREPAHIKLARYIAASGTELTHADMVEKLPYYKSTTSGRNEMLTLARSWGYKNHIIIKKRFVDDGIEVFSGETLEQTDLNKMILSYSDHFAYDYGSEEAVPFDALHMLTQAPNMHWSNHRFKDGHRAEVNAIAGFNMVVLDVDGGVKLDAAHKLLKDYRFMTYTTKRHGQDGQDRFRLIMPINYVLKMDSDDYKEFMSNVMEWIFFPTDDSADQRSKKWMTCELGTHHYNEGAVLDALQFIPRTSKNEAFRNTMRPLQSLDALERWFALRMVNGDRNKQMIKFALALVDNGMTFAEVENAVLNFDAKLPDPLGEAELRDSILLTVARKLHETA